MSKYVGARSHASQVAADHRSRIAAGNASRLAAAGLALFLTFGFGGVAQAASDKASDKASDQASAKAQENGQGVAAEGAAGTPTATGAGPATGAEQAAEKAAEKPAEVVEVVEISAVSSESAVSTLVVEKTAHGVTTTEATTTPVAETPAGTEPITARTTTDPATAVGLMAKTTNQPNANAADASSNAGGAGSNAGGAGSNAGGAGSNAGGASPNTGGHNGGDNGQGGNGTGSGQPDGGTYVETIVCHKDGVVLVIDDSGLNGHAADRFDHGHLEGVAECADRDNDGVPDTVDAGPDDSNNTDVVRTPVDGCEDESMTSAPSGAADATVEDVDECDGDAAGGGSDTDCEQSGETCTDEDEIEVDDEPEKVHPTVPGDKVEGPGPTGPGSWNNGGKAGGKKPKPEVLGEEGERPRGTKTPGKGGKTTTTDVDRTPGGRVPSQPEPTENDRSARDGEVLGEAAERPSKNRPAALVLPQTGAASNMAAQAGAGLILVLGGLLTLRSRRRDSES